LQDEQWLWGVVSDMEAPPRQWAGPPTGLTKDQAVRIYARKLGCEPKVRTVKAVALEKLTPR
jgi:hypothetical protein